MKDRIYLNDNEVILNFDLVYPETSLEVIKSKEFKVFMQSYIAHLEETDSKLYNWATQGKSLQTAIEALSTFARQTLVFSAEEIESPYIEDRTSALSFVEGMYDFWKAHERYSVTTDRRRESSSTTFVHADSSHNQLIMATYRRIEETLMGRANKIYRQQPAGTNAALSLYKNESFKLGARYESLRKVKFIDSIMLRTPMILHPKSNKREWAFQQVYENPLDTFKGNSDEFFCFPAKVGDLTVFVYFHRDFMSNGVSLANLFELASKKEASKKPDCVLIFGNDDGKNACTFYHDEEENIWVGSVTRRSLTSDT